MAQLQSKVDAISTNAHCKKTCLMNLGMDPQNKLKEKQILAPEANTELHSETPSESQSPETDEQARCA